MKQDAAEQQVALFREASPYIHKHRNQTFVIAFSGDVIEQDNFRRLIQDIAIIATLGVRIVIVHGTRPQIEKRLLAQGQPSRFHEGIRITDAESLTVAQEACGYLRIKIENLFSSALNQPLINSESLSIISGNFISARSLGVYDGIDYQSTGKVRRIRTPNILEQLTSGNIVLISPIAYSPSGYSYNLSYEETAIQTASALQADKLIFIAPHMQKLPSYLTHKQALTMGSQTDLLPLVAQKIDSQTIERAHIIDSQIDGGLLLELHTREGIGCMISRGQTEIIRPATFNDVPHILDLIRPLEQKGTLVKRSRQQLENDLVHFHVAEIDQQVVGCVALYQYEKAGELACLAVDQYYRAAQRGDQLLQYIETLAQKIELKQLIVLTTQTTDWFRERGFIEGGVEDLPQDKKKLYNYKRNSRILVKQL